jgi:hypothetical protein
MIRPKHCSNIQVIIIDSSFIEGWYDAKKYSFEEMDFVDIMVACFDSVSVTRLACDW